MAGVGPDPGSARRPRRALLVYNPEAGRGPRPTGLLRTLLGLQAAPSAPPRTPDLLERIRRVLESGGVHAETAVSSHPGEATRLARQAADQGCDMVVAVGGDGTLNEVVNGLAGSSTALAVVPTGTVNVFALQAGLPLDPEAAAWVAVAGRTARLDLGRIHGRYFLSMAGIGFDAHVVRRVDSRLKRAWGAVAYAWVGLTRYFRYPFRSIPVRLDDQPERTHRGYAVLIGNGRYYAGKLVLSPRADPGDGLLDVCLFKRKRIWNFIGYWWGLRRGRLDRFLDVECLQCRKLTVTGRRRHAVHVDAEYAGHTPASVEVVPGALRVVMPEPEARPISDTTRPGSPAK